ncbi:MAG: DUF1924 domain-containing protein [Gammaproteobacteria bacterium]|nr:DUF1924 domain-containing protein [Gammaproteobacteria bacterium]
MKKKLLIPVLLLGVSTAYGAGTVTKLLQEYRDQGAGPFGLQAGEKLWVGTHTYKDGVSERSCTSCHGDDLTQSGKHQRTGKLIEPMAPALNAQRLGDRKKIEKWFKRNCKWTFGRECSPQEKGDIILFIQSQS